MKHLIPGFSNYFFDEQEILYVVRKGENIKVKIGDKKSNLNSAKVKADNGKWNWKAINGLKALAGLKYQLPKSAKPIKGTNNIYHIDTEGNVYSFGVNNPQGIKLTPHISTSGYPVVHLRGEGIINRLSVAINILMCETFIMEDYTKKGLCCLHLNNIKTDNRLENLAVGTYSQNNKQAYADGLNPGNGLKKVK
jgi:hypothetical protein